MSSADLLHGRSASRSGWQIPGRLFADAERPATRGLDPQQHASLSDFFGDGRKGALRRTFEFQVPVGLSREILERYHEVARHWIERGKDQNCCQVARLCLVERALADMERV